LPANSAYSPPQLERSLHLSAPQAEALNAEGPSEPAVTPTL
jgi:hypothetical protein